MFGKHWTAARGTIVDRKGKTTGDGMVTTYEFVVDVTTEGGEVFRAKAEEPRIATGFKDPLVGDNVAVEYDAESRKVRFDKDDPALSWKHYKKSRADKFDASLAAPAGTPAAGFPAPQLPDLSQLQSFLQTQGLPAHGLQAGQPGVAQVIQVTPGSPEAAAVREALLRALGGVMSPADATHPDATPPV